MKKMVWLLILLMILTGCKADTRKVETKDIEAEPIDEKIYVEPIDEDTFKRAKLLIQKELDIFDFNDEHDILQEMILDVVNTGMSEDEMKVAVSSVVEGHMETVKKKTIEKVLSDNEIPYSTYDVDDLMRVTTNDALVDIVVAFEMQVTKDALKE